MLYPYLKQIKPIKPIQEKIDLFLSKHDFTNTIGIHIRKGDKLVGNRFDRKIGKTIKLILDKKPEYSIFLATDGYKSEKAYIKNFGNKILYYPKQFYADPWNTAKNRHLKALYEAVVDMWLLSHTKSIITTLGTFGACAANLGNRKIVNAIQRLDEKNPYRDFLIFPQEINRNKKILPKQIYQRIFDIEFP
jgi:hypothetical protein